jgi:uncharacterized RDD family membrane protein YckC
MLDTVRQIETPEGVSLRLHAAGPVPRAQAWLVDILLLSVVDAVFMSIVGSLGRAGMGLGMLVVFASSWAYDVICEVWMGGQTVGKRVNGLRVVNADGTPVTLLPSVLRNLLRVVDLLPGVYGVGLACCLVDRHFRRIGDIVAGTMVVHVLGRRAATRIRDVSPEPPAVPLSLDEQEAIVEFSARAGELHVERQRELADQLEPLTRRLGNAAVDRLIAHANWLLGRT